ncbi:phosphatidylserine decarboxylase [Seongchinamella sediminis]|uniref:Phosphatidylserine decarboxylase proenzyme n=1 Tax=Seongchinamella sediminis TaxID=2283635 RepID=A0A3L7E211_9GAMM|nr:archaetidylserine decarboxylase [Seongchinamella sediminis]RLQ22363.1 phosphatidylserine decarboxylase [Seongchinamella sediminis]
MDRIFIFLQYIVPQHLLSRLTGWLAELEHPLWLKNRVIGLFVRHFNVDMSEALEPDYQRYPSFNAFFTRALQDGARPIAEAPVVCPADGAISQLGDIVDGRIFQAKGQDYSCVELLAGDPEWAEKFADGSFATIYLSPRDYHRVHMPVAGRLLATSYVPGELFSVNGVTAANVERLFARNERLVCYFDTEFGPMAMILVGAMVVAGIETVWSGQVAPPPKLPVNVDYGQLPEQVSLAQGEEMGRFKLGSTVILLFPQGAVRWQEQYAAGTPTRLGEPLA